jgi:hypothetical protein
MRKLCFLIPLIFVFSLVKAQSPIPADYQRAKSELSAKNYLEAMQLFKQFTDENRYGNLAKYARLHLGESAIAAKQAGQAISTLQPITLNSWSKSEEAKYLLALAYFQNNQKAEALRVIKMIDREELKTLAANVSYEYLRTESPDFMVTNLQEFKSNPGYTAAMKVVLEGKTILSATERAAYYELKGLGQSSQNKVVNDVLDIAVILPFTNGSNDSISSSDFVFELYQGIEFARKKLANQGVKINVNTFNSQRDLAQLDRLLADPVVGKADVIIGPIYPEESDMVSMFAEQIKIPFIHPLSNLGERFEESNYSYLFRPAVTSLAQGIIKGLKIQKWGTRVAIGYSGSSRDEKLAAILIQELPKAGFQIVESKVVNSRNVSQFLQGLGIRTGNLSFSLKTDQIILLTDDPTIAQPTFGLFESVSTSIPTLVLDSWLTFNFANYEMLEFPNFYFIGNNAVNFDSEPTAKFKKDFYETYKINPSMNHYLGFELVSWLASNMSSTKGFDLRRNLNQSPYQKGQLTWGFNFQKSNNNQYVPVFKFEEGKLNTLN